MKVVFLGDVVGRSGREAVFTFLPEIRKRLSPALIIANVENAAGGFGITAEIGQEFFDAGVHVLTSGNHIWDQKNTKEYINREPRLLRPLNFPAILPGKGLYAHPLENGKKLIVINLMGNLFMDPLDLSFPLIDRVLKEYPLSSPLMAGIIVDFHAEATGEKMALAQYLDGRVTAVIGTHTHIPTADAQLFDKGTGFQSDAGMCGDYNSVLGMKTHEAIRRFSEKTRGGHYEPSTGEGTVCGVVISIGLKGECTSLSSLILGPRLVNKWPEDGF